MDREVQPKFGLMVSLILMNVTAIVLFFFATPTSSEIPKKQVKQADNVPIVQTELVMAGDADNKIAVEDENVTVMGLHDAKMESMEEDVVSLKRTSKAGAESSPLSLGGVRTLNPRHSPVEAQVLSGKVEMRVDVSKKATCRLETSDGPTEPPLAIAWKKFVGNTNSGVRIFFEGLKNGYTIKRLRENESSNTCVKKIKGAEGAGQSTRLPLRESIFSNTSIKMSKVMERVIGSTGRDSKVNPSPNQMIQKPSQPTIVGSTKPSVQGSEVNPRSNHGNAKPLHDPFPTQNLPDPLPTLGLQEDGSSISHEAVPTEFVMNVLSQTQKHTNELIYVFSKRVVPAIERMNDKVAEAVRLEKNLDSYTSALINAINSVVCPNTETEMNVKHKHSKPSTSDAKKPKHTKPFCSDMSLMRDSRIHDYVGTFSKGEYSSPNKRPVFKTLAARCCHTSVRYKRATNKPNKKRNKRSNKLNTPEGRLLELQKSDEDISALKMYDTSEGVLEQTGHFDTNDLQESHLGLINGSSSLTESPLQRTICIEEVLALTSCIEQNSDHGVQSEGELLPFLSPLNMTSNISMSSGMASRSYVIEHPELVRSAHNQKETEPENVQLKSECTEPSGSAASHSSELPEDLPDQARQQEDSVASDFSIVFGSRIQGYDSCSVQKEISTVATYSSENNETRLSGPSQTDSEEMAQLGESNHSISLPGDMKNAIELVTVFQKLNQQQKEVALENVCLLVLRMFEAWSDSQKSISSSGLSRLSMSSWPSTNQMALKTRQPRTAIRRSRIDSGQEQKYIMSNTGSTLTKDDTCKENIPNEPTSSKKKLDPAQASTEISPNWMQNVVEAAEIHIKEKSLMGLKTNLLQTPPLKGDSLKDSMNMAGVNQSGFGDIKDTIIMDEELAALLKSTSHESIKVSKESSSATFYTGQPESSEDAFYECVSTLSAGTCGSLQLEDSSTSFLERIQEEETRVHNNEDHVLENPPGIVEPRAMKSTFSVESWLSDSEEDLRAAKDTLNSEEFPVSDGSSFDIGCGTDDEAYPCSSHDLSGDESKAKKDKQGQSKKKKWAAKLFKKLLKKKSKPSSFPSVALSKNTSRSQSDSLLKHNDQNDVTNNGEPTQ